MISMRVDLPKSDTWYTANEQAREYLKIADDPNVSVQVYLGVRHALWEVTQALANTFSHRRTIGYTPFSGPEGEFVALQFAKEGFTVKSLSVEEFNSPKPWLETAAKQMLCLLSAYDDPATGELYQTEAHVSAMKDQRIFRILISHCYHQNRALEKVGPYDVQIISLKPDLAIAVLGERAKLSPPVASNLDWKKIELAQAFAVKSADEIDNSKKALAEFHKLLPSGVAEFYSSQESLHDRAVLMLQNIEGLSFITSLAKELGLQLRDPGRESELETLSVCRWQDPRQLEWLAPKGLTIDKLRGSAIISAGLVQKVGPAKLVRAIETVHKHLLSEQQL
jgi:hypothetical protein